MATERELDLRLVEKGNAIEQGLTEWEVNFIESLNKWMTKNESLTKDQRAKLVQILQKKG